MINIYYGREAMDKSKFIFSNIGKKAIIIVPDQYTLQAERDALKYLKTEGILDIQIMGFSRFASAILKEAGIKMDVISREGREMLLAGIIRNSKADLKVFRGISNTMDLVTTFHDFIAEMKQTGAGPIELADAIDHLKDGTILKEKLEDVHLIYEKYCQVVAGKYMDNEDFMTKAAEKIGDSKNLENTEIWLYAFDSFTGKHFNILKALNDKGLSVNPVVTWDKNGQGLFEISDRMIRKLQLIAGEDNWQLNEIPKEYAQNRVAEIAYLEKHYEEVAPEKIKNQGAIKLVRCSNPYSEACTAANWIWHLVRDKGYRLRDIGLICNNMEENKELYERVFADYGIELFVDCKRDAMYHPVMNLLVSIMKIISFEYQREDVIKYVKTGFTDLTEDEIRRLEIYTYKYKITGRKWAGRFKIGLLEYTQEEIDHFEQCRQKIITPINDLKSKISKVETLGEKIKCLYRFLDESLNLREKLQQLVTQLEEKGQLDLAKETAQLWQKIVDIFQQMVSLLGHEKVSNVEFIELLKSGIAAIEIGVIPPAQDGLVMGNIQRSRRENVKAMVIVSANEGILPESGKKAAIVSDQERNVLRDNNLEICKISRLQAMEEKLALYRTLTKPSESLYISYPMADNTGSQLEPSQVVSKVVDMFDDLELQDDLFKAEQVEPILGGYETTKASLVNSMANFMETGAINENWRQIYQWYNSKEDMDQLVDRLFENFKQPWGNVDKVLDLYGKKDGLPLRISPSRLELYGKCPFSHFVKYALRPTELVQYQIGPSEAGTVYHNCMMILSKKLKKIDGNGDTIPITDETSPWMNVTREEVHNMVDGILKDISTEYKEGLLSSGKYEQYKAKRIQKVCEDSAWMAIDHVRRGKIKDMFFEIPFGGKKNLEGMGLPGILINTQNGKISIEGQIDRWDILKGDYSKVIDYKSGNDTFNMELAKSGMKLQLFIYLMAVSNEKYKPGGAFYFHIDEGCTDVPNEITYNDKELISQYKMDGFALEEGPLLTAIDPDDKKPRVYKKSGNRILPPEDFNENLSVIMEKVKQMGTEILEGEMAIKPKDIKNIESCTFCPYRGICKFDISISGCKYNAK